MKHYYNRLERDRVEYLNSETKILKGFGDD
jgi:hypothetical protein